MILRGHLTLLERCAVPCPRGAAHRAVVCGGHVPPQTLDAIVQSLEEFLFLAYEPDEYLWYVEAHLPRLKSRVDDETGVMHTRHPHLHVAIWLRKTCRQGNRCDRLLCLEPDSIPGRLSGKYQHPPRTHQSETKARELA